MQQNHPMCRPLACLAAATIALLVPCCAALAQNLVTNPGGAPTRWPAAIAPAIPAPKPGTEQPSPPAPSQTPAAQQPSENVQTAAIASQESAGASALSGVSLFAVVPPQPKKYAKHDVIEVIINESSAESFTQTTDFKKDYDLKGELAKFPSLSALFSHGTLTDGIGTIHPGIGLTANKELKGNGKIDRKDQVTAKISAFVVDVKPNGNLVLEARESRSSDKEVTTMVLSGTCRAEDLTKSNTIQSSQLAGLTIRIEHEGDVKESGQKGFIPRILEAVFNF